MYSKIDGKFTDQSTSFIRSFNFELRKTKRKLQNVANTQQTKYVKHISGIHFNNTLIL